MKWIHTADWHLGKIVHGESMLNNQRKALETFLLLVEREQPDAIVIAGDLYDRAVPPTEAVELLDQVLGELILDRKIPVIAVSGNHDSAERLQFASSLLKRSGLHLAGKLNERIEAVEIKGVNFHLVPFAEPSIARYVFSDPAIRTHDDAMRRIIEGIELSSGPNVLVGHAFVTGGLETDSERQLSIGTAGQVSASLFERFDYTALGHLHNPLALRSEKVRYSGSLLKYSFSEATHVKGVDVLEWDGTGFSRRFEPIMPMRDLREISGKLEELIDPEFYDQQVCEDYLKINLTDEEALIDPMGTLKRIYPNILHLERTGLVRESTRAVQATRDQVQTASISDLFLEFYADVREKEPTSAMKMLLEEEESCGQKD